MNHPFTRVSLRRTSAVIGGTAVSFGVPWSAHPALGIVGGLFLVAWTVLLPGWALTRMLGERGRDALETAGLWVMHGLTVALACAFVWALSGMTVNGFGVLIALVPGVMAVVAPRRDRTRVVEAVTAGRGERLARFSLIGLLLLLCTSVYVAGVPVGFQNDTIDYVAYTNEIAETGHAFPVTEFYKDAGPDGADLRKGLLHALYGSYKSQLGLDTLQLFSLLAALFLGAATLLVYTAARRMLGDGAAGALAAILFLLCYDSGPGTALIRTWFYPSRFGFAPLLMLTAACLAMYSRPTVVRAIVCFLYAFTVAAVHIQYTVLSGLVVAVILLWKTCASPADWTTHIKRALPVVIVVLAGMLPYGVFRYVTAFQSSDLHTQVQGAVFVFGRWFVIDPTLSWNTAGPLLAAAVLSIFPLWRLRRENAGVGFAAAALVSVLFVQYNPFVLTSVYHLVTYLVYRLGQITAYFLLPATLVVWAARGRLRGRAGFAGGLALLLTVVSVFLAIGSMPNGLAWTGAERQAAVDQTYRRWGKGLEALAQRLPAGSVIVSDPVTSYTITAFTPHFVVCTLDQHAPPNDRYALDRIATARDILSPLTRAAEKVSRMKAAGATHVLINENIPPGMILDSWTMDPAIAPQSRRSFEQWPGVFRRVALPDSLTLFKLVGPDPPDVEPPRQLFLVSELPASAKRIGREAGEAGLAGATVGSAGASRGDAFRVDLYWLRSGEKPPAKYVVSIRLDYEGLTLPIGGRPFPKLARKLKEAIDGRRYRARDDHMIAYGFYGPDSWPAGVLVRDSARVTIPPDLAPGRYTLRATLLSIAHAPNHRLHDFFFDDDIYNGVEIGNIVVK